MEGNPTYIKREILVCRDGVFESKQDEVVIEKPLTVFLNHNELATLICSPGGLPELTVGFLISEGLIQDRSDIADIRCQDEEGLIWLETTRPIAQTNNFLRRHIASCCGKGRAGLYFINDARQLQPVSSDYQIGIKDLYEFMRLLDDRSDTFRKTGGVHSAALAEKSGLIVCYEDIGRHNAVDKVLGYAFLKQIPTDDKCLLLSGRIASEILIKAARSGIPLILSRSAPTELTIELAEELQICVVGFARGKKLNIYTHPSRVAL
ncbi:MAG: formate dehydrogenase accessory sulfurtransferase FdhD [Firmicutes bacterium]|nr:formate dehydrogenase accessory sulfurtransferase FdhD [Bacillota bacterium]